MPADIAEAPPAPGQIAFVRQRRYLVESVVAPPADGEACLVSLSCLDDDAQGEPLTVLWEHELDARVLSDDGWASVAERGFDDPALFAAYLRTLSWNCVTATDPNLFQAPFRAGIRLDAYQLEPLRKALRLPRVNLFIADDVGLGKTIEAGLIARELLLRRRVDRIVIACPPSLLDQWRDEMATRFGLAFAILDRAYVTRMRRERGFAINPWTTHSRFLVSHRLLIDEAYASGLRDWLGEFAPQSLLILDEAHNAAPSSGAQYAIDYSDHAGHTGHRTALRAPPVLIGDTAQRAFQQLLCPSRDSRSAALLPRCACAQRTDRRVPVVIFFASDYSRIHTPNDRLEFVHPEALGGTFLAARAILQSPEFAQWVSQISRAQFAVFTHQQWVGWVQEHDTEGKWSDWLSYVRSRYSLGG